MNANENMKKILDKIKEYDKIYLFRHFRPDGDAIGSTKGLQRILQLSFPEKEILLQNEDFSDYLAFLGGEEEIQPLDTYKDALGIVLDTGTSQRVSCQNFVHCKEIVKIDHHIPLESYGSTEWVEEERSSTCEMVAAFYDAFKDELKIDVEAATYIYTGMVTDSGRFRFRSVSGDTLRLAGLILDQGVDVDVLYANLYLKNFDEFKFQAYVYEKMQITENGVAHIFVDQEMKDTFSLSNEAASACVGYMDSIKDVIVWIAFIDSGDGSIRVRLRSRFVTISELAERYHGGGHACAAGATVYSVEEMRQLIAEANELVKEFKANNTGWL